jgi:hypothetical protein
MEVKLYRFRDGDKLFIIAAQNFEEAEKLFRNGILNKELLQEYKESDARVVYYEDKYQIKVKDLASAVVVSMMENAADIIKEMVRTSYFGKKDKEEK